MASRGRSTSLKIAAAVELAARKSPQNTQYSQEEETPIFKPEWFSGDPEIETGENEDQEAPSGKDVEDTSGRPDHYLPYIPVGDQYPYPSLLVKGSVCRYIMLLRSKNLKPISISKTLASQENLGQYSAMEIKGIINI